ncbi:response regulator transcription factor [Selenomonas sp.]|uniref:response regulator transcription factor n=1 Tax=Selenomonas sp. TaxID=2053611 RepID=UPI0025D6731D|nr:response regulator transcription factor [Selenomonas sp.]MCI6085544.1 response regulator transcription factor [Selenomonas sp.]MCI6283604.1 response regulator transcription factor [Selenomonas sp.]MDY3298401.1 response regulator transcription factor [Selenomonas sp.]
MATEEPVRIFIVEDERRIARFLQIELEHEGYETATEDNGQRAFERIGQEKFDLVLLDVMLPDLDGFEVCRKVREFSNVPIIMLTAKDELEDKVTGLDLGADDYITKPFAIQELMARIRAALRKHTETDGPEGERLTCKNLVLYPSRYEVTVNGEEIHLTKKEYSLLEYLLRNKRNVLTRDQILQEVWGYDYAGDTNVVDVYIRYLRAKIDERFSDKYIYTVRGVGYVIKD